MAQHSGPTSSPVPCGGTESILSVESNAEIRALIVEQLESLGYRVTQAASGDEALALLEQPANRFELLLSGVAMAGKLTGVELARIARARWPGLGVVLVSSTAPEVETSFQLLLKPFRKMQLARTVRLALAGAGDEACA